MRNWSTVGAFALAVLLGAVFLRGAAAEKAAPEIRATRFVLTDRDGKSRAELGTRPDGSVALRLADARGVNRATLSVAADGVSRLALHGADGRPRAQVTTGPDDWPSLVFFDKQGMRRAALDISLGGWPVFALADDRGDDRAVLQVVPDGTPVLVLFDKTGRVIWKTP